MNYWDLSKEEQKKIEDKGIDYDLRACMEYNSFSFTIFDIEKVLAVHQGENDGDDWRWVVKVNKSCSLQHNKQSYVFIQGGCGYTGWDCQSWATHEFRKTALEAAKLSLGDVKLGDSQPYQAGLGHMLSILGGGYGDNFKEVYDELVMQIKSSKNKTWRENKDDEFKNDLPKVG